VIQINSDLNQLVISKLTIRFGPAILGSEIYSDMLSISVQRETVPEIMSFLRNETELDYNFLTTLCGMHYPEKEQLGVVYHLQSMMNNHRIRIKTATPVDNPNIPSITGIWPAANWMERETFDFYGILFTGHPNLKRILNVDDMIGYPLRKDFPLEDQTREDKDDSMFGR
jgi:NADH-quinone oxidoreductase subunit C